MTLQVGDRVRYCKAWLDRLGLVRMKLAKKMTHVNAATRGTVADPAFTDTGSVRVKWDDLDFVVPCYLRMLRPA